MYLCEVDGAAVGNLQSVSQFVKVREHLVIDQVFQMGMVEVYQHTGHIRAVCQFGHGIQSTVNGVSADDGIEFV
jgi:hypothetical protein